MRELLAEELRALCDRVDEEVVVVRSGGCWNRMESCSRYVNQTTFFNVFNVDRYFGSCGTSQQIWSDDLIL